MPHNKLPPHAGTAPENAELIVYAVHGRGQGPEFMAATAARIDLPRVSWVLPAAPGRSWYPEGFMADPARNQPNLDAALDTVRTHVTALRATYDAPLVLFGFSQGACLLSEFLVRDQPHIDGALLHTGGYLGPHERRWKNTSSLHGLPVQMLTAAEDAWVPLKRVRQTQTALQRLEAAVELTVFDDPEHHINEASVAEIREFLGSFPRAA